MYKVYYTTPSGDVRGDEFESMTVALSFAETMRKTNCSFVTMVSENPNVVGKLGVDGIVDGKLPDGNDYTWKKRRS
jgi:hypothetical protein